MKAQDHTPVGIIGLGIIGSRIAENVVKAGFPGFVWSRSARAIPNFLASPHEVAQAAKVLQIFVRDDAALRAAIDDLRPALTPDHIVMNHATVSAEATRDVAKIVQSTGAAFLDAPFTGSKMAAQNGKLVYYIGGNEEVLERAQPVLAASAAKVIHVGEIGEAMVLKIATNMITAITVKGIHEALEITRAANVEPRKLLTALESNANFSPLVGMKLPAMIEQKFDAHFSLRNMLKDADFARSMAAKASVSVPALDAMAAAMRAKLDAGKGDFDFSVIGESVTDE